MGWHDYSLPLELKLKMSDRGFTTMRFSLVCSEGSVTDWNLVRGLLEILEFGILSHQKSSV